MARTQPAPMAIRGSWLLSVAIVVAIGIVNLIWAFTDWHFNDLNAYYEAALRIREGDVLYGGEVQPWTAYRYAPWFAYAFLPLSYLPWTVLAVAWSVFTIGCSVLAVWPLIRHRTRPALMLAGIMGPLLVAVSASGNIQAAMVALLVWTVHGRWGPVTIGLAASLKVTPILLALTYLGRREWRRAAVAAVVAIVLWAPALAFTIEPITLNGGGGLSTVEWLVLGGGSIAGAVIVSQHWPRYGLLSTGVAAYLATPRLFLYDTTILLVSVGQLNHHETQEPRASEIVG